MAKIHFMLNTDMFGGYASDASRGRMAKEVRQLVHDYCDGVMQVDVFPLEVIVTYSEFATDPTKVFQGVDKAVAAVAEKPNYFPGRGDKTPVAYSPAEQAAIKAAPYKPQTPRAPPLPV